MSETAQIQRYFSVGQMRIDLWNELANTARALAAGPSRTDETSWGESSLALLESLMEIERYFSYPGRGRIAKLLGAVRRHEYLSLVQQVDEIGRRLVSDAYRGPLEFDEYGELIDESPDASGSARRVNDASSSIRCSVLFVEDISESDEQALRSTLRELQDPEAPFTYDTLVQPSLEDALVSIAINPDIQALVVRYAPPLKSRNLSERIRPFVQHLLPNDLSTELTANRGPILGQLIRELRPEIDVYYVTDTALANLKDTTIRLFRRIFYRREDLQELHLAILQGIRARYQTPFFTALREYSHKPTGVFHAMPVSRGNSVFRSRWIRDFGEFYGRNLFLAETSSTTGGLDSLLQPTGPLKRAQELAASAYGAQHTFFATNGTSTSNKIVLQALVEPEDLVLIDRDCHKSHHYGLVLSGAIPVYLDSYPIERFSMYGAVPLEHIEGKLRELERAGRLDRVKMLLLTNCTFDGLVYNVQRVMERVLAIKPDIIFLWDEAWFAFASHGRNYRQRTAMHVAAKLHRKLGSAEYRAHYEGLSPEEQSLAPDPDRARIRVYSTQSTHKTLTSLRQGSMIHVWDEDFRRLAETSFSEAYMTHTSTSPNYQILGSLDVGRRQVQLEGYELVERSTELAMVLRARIDSTPQLKKYFDVLTVKDFVPDQYRESGLSEYWDQERGWSRMEGAWTNDEFVLDPTKITLFVGRTGVDGDTFKTRYLMDKFNIQVNKTSRNTVLLMTNIGTTRGSVAYLINALLQISQQLDEKFRALNDVEQRAVEARIRSLTHECPPLPHFSRFHASFQAVPGVPGGNLREAFFLAYREDACEYRSLQRCRKDIAAGDELVASTFVIPYPPGFPVLVPGQVVSEQIVEFLLALDVTEIHGYRPEVGLRLFNQEALERSNTSNSPAAT